MMIENITIDDISTAIAINDISSVYSLRRRFDRRSFFIAAAFVLPRASIEGESAKSC